MTKRGQHYIRKTTEQEQHKDDKGEGGDATQSPPYHSRPKVTQRRTAPPPPKTSQDQTFFASLFRTLFDANLASKRPPLGPLLATQIGPRSAQDVS